MKHINIVVAASLSAAILAACTNQRAFAPQVTEATLSQVQISLEDSADGPTLYASGRGGAAVFAAGGAKYLRKLRPKTGPVATDQKGHLFVGGETATAVDVYENRGAKLAWKVQTKPSYPGLLVVDKTGNVYENCGDSNLCEYGPHNTGLLRQIRGYGSMMALDAAGYLYLAMGFNSIGIYVPGSTSPERTITNGIAGPIALALDSGGNLYVANAYVGSKRTPNVSVYAPGASSPVLSITTGLTAPWGMTTDSAGNLYVLNECANSGGCTNDQNSVAVYARGSNTPLQVVIDGLDYPVSIVTDRANNLYVANVGSSLSDHGSVTVYASGTYSLIRKVTHNVDNPGFLAVGP